MTVDGIINLWQWGHLLIRHFFHIRRIHIKQLQRVCVCVCVTICQTFAKSSFHVKINFPPTSPLLKKLRLQIFPTSLSIVFLFFFSFFAFSLNILFHYQHADHSLHINLVTILNKFYLQEHVLLTIWSEGIFRFGGLANDNRRTLNVLKKMQFHCSLIFYKI